MARPQWDVADTEAGPSPALARLLERQPWDLLTPILARAGADAAAVVPGLRRYGELLLAWNRGRSNLISAGDESRLVERHILESIEPMGLLAASGARRWMDFGSGGGLPAIPLIIAGIGDDWTLVESRRNKVLFLRKAIQEIGLQRVDVRQARLETLDESDEPGHFDGFTSRATMRLLPTLSLAARWVVSGGSAFLWKGSRKDEELAHDRSWERSWELAEQVTLGSGPTVVARFIRRPA